MAECDERRRARGEREKPADILRAMTLFTLLPHWLRAFLLNFSLWTMLCLVAGATTWGEADQHGDQRSFWQMCLGWWVGYLVMMVQSYSLCMVYRRHPAWLATPRRIAAGYLAFIGSGWPIAMLGLAFRRVHKLDLDVSLANALHYWVTMNKFEWFVVFVMLTMAFGAVTAGLLWLQRQQQVAELAQARLALEVQKLTALRGQLEPHFLFNTLSAIGALVRLDDRPLALQGLARLGNLLQYALAGSERNWIELEDELRFVQDYLDLQRLRFGDRLQVRIDGVQALDKDIDCPPMLLQPLVENALRHDLECHADASDIAIAFARDGGMLQVSISNPVRANAAPSAGLGIGLRGTRARLQLAYGGAAALDTTTALGRFTATLRLPVRNVR